MIADAGPQRARDRPLVLDRQEADAAPRVQLIGRGEGIGGAGALAGIATAAPPGARRIGCQRGGGVDRAQKEPVAQIPAEQVRMLALPADPRRLGQRFFHHRRGIDEHLHRISALLDQPARQAFERRFHDIVIIPAAGIDRNAAMGRRIGVGGGVIGGQIVARRIAHRQHDDRLHLGPERGRLRTLVGAALHPDHVAMPPIGQPALQPLAGFRRQRGRGHAASGKAFRSGAGLDRILHRKLARVHHTPLAQRRIKAKAVWQELLRGE